MSRLRCHLFSTLIVYIFFLVSDDIRDVDLTSVHNLSGPIAVQGAEPGDCLVVDILDGMFQEMRLLRKLKLDVQ